MIRPYASCLILIVFGLGSCMGPTWREPQAGDSPAVVQGRKDVSGVVALLSLATIADPTCTAVGPAVPPGEPDEVRILLVDEAPVSRHRIELSPGTHTLQVLATGLNTDIGARQSGIVDLTCDFEANRQYRLVGRPSTRQAPWSIELVTGRPSVTVASSEPSIDQLQLPPLPEDIPFGISSADNLAGGVANAWELADWGLWANYEFTRHEPTTLRAAQPGEQLERSRQIPDDRLSLSNFQYRRQRQMEQSGFHLDVEPLALQLGWIERWERPASADSAPEWGVAIHREAGRWIESVIYRTSRGPGADDRCNAWEQRLLACMGARPESTPRAASEEPSPQPQAAKLMAGLALLPGHLEPLGRVARLARVQVAEPILEVPRRSRQEDGRARQIRHVQHARRGADRVGDQDLVDEAHDRAPEAEVPLAAAEHGHEALGW